MKKICIVCGKEFETLDKRKTKCSKECIKKYLSQKKKENWQNPEYKEQQSEKIKKGQNNPTSKKKMSLKKKGKSSWNKGIPCSEKQKEKISTANKGRIPWNKDKTGVYTQETKDKISKQVKKSITDDIRKKMSIIAQNRVVSEDTKNKISQKLLNRTDEEIKLFVEKVDQTKRKNNTFNTSKPEIVVFDLLNKKFETIKKQYKSNEYPWKCDFYIQELDLYIEYQGHWSHGGCAFDKNNLEHLKKLEKWENKNNKFYKNAIKTWTKRDPLKRETARKNNLNWIEFFTMDQFMEWYNKQ